ncbi:copper resistance CopC/CopD family protein [Bacillus safensis]|uniref:copper resistance CopC/CopD family protein n=1 Tax=Bacillus safensis TaxID=561879 RepID=UPI00203F0FB5|nr:copper resistance CopC/CopD family protein [Bacillus safensis]MCM3028319.1 copper resistance CopC/CopD family protein [Bacillus safensis]
MFKNSKWLLLLMVMFAFFIPKEAFAHAYVVSSNPAANEELEQQPPSVSITFSEGIESGFHAIKVLNAKGDRVDKGDTVIKDQKIMEAALKKNLPKGIYTIQWNAVSADGHSVSGMIPFSIGKADGGFDQLEQGQTDESIDVASTIDKAFLYTSFSLFLGTILFGLLWFKTAISPVLAKRMKRLLTVSLIMMGGALVFQLPIQTKSAADVSFWGAFQPSLLQETIASTSGGSLWMMLMASFVLLTIWTIVAVRKGDFSSFRVWLFPLLLFTVLLWVKAQIGHPAATDNKILTTSLDFIHLVSASIWVGGLTAIVLLLMKKLPNEDQPLIRSTLAAFHPWALLSVGLIVFSGFVNAIFILQSFDALFHSAYGRTFLIKLGLFIIMGLLGLMHYLMLRWEKKQKRSISLRAEWMIGIAILLLTAVFTNIPSPPPPAPEPYFGANQVEHRDIVSLSITPNAPGKNSFEVAFTKKNGETITDIQSVTAKIHKVALFGDETPSEFQLKRLKNGHFSAENLLLNEKGTWKIEIHALTGSFKNIDTTFIRRN